LNGTAPLRLKIRNPLYRDGIGKTGVFFTGLFEDSVSPLSASAPEVAPPAGAQKIPLSR
jgi:hypothetical protein